MVAVSLKPCSWGTVVVPQVVLEPSQVLLKSPLAVSSCSFVLWFLPCCLLGFFASGRAFFLFGFSFGLFVCLFFCLFSEMALRGFELPRGRFHRFLLVSWDSKWPHSIKSVSAACQDTQLRRPQVTPAQTPCLGCSRCLLPQERWSPSVNANPWIWRMPASVGEMSRVGQWGKTDTIFVLSFKPGTRLQNTMVLVFWISLRSRDSVKINSFVSGDYLLILYCCCPTCY